MAARGYVNPQITKTNRVTVYWNRLLNELGARSQFHQAIHLYIQMLRSGDMPNSFSFPFPLKSCTALSLHFTGYQLHSHALKSGSLSEPFTQSSLITFYGGCSLAHSARKVLEENPLSSNSTVCHNALISAYTSNCCFQQAAFLFSSMRRCAVPYDAITFLSLIPACRSPPHLPFATVLHAEGVKSGFENESSVFNCFLSMYMRCGAVHIGRKMFDEMEHKGLVAWNTVITGYTQNGFADMVMELYREMRFSGTEPDAITLLAVLASSAHLGSQCMGEEVEGEMKRLGFISNIYLNNALISMYSRCGNLAKARAIFEGMGERNLVSWTAIIGGHGIHGDGEAAVRLFDEMVGGGIEPDGTVFVSVLSACSHAGLTEEGSSYFSQMKQVYGLCPSREHYSCMVDLLGRAGRMEEALALIQSMPMEADSAAWGALLAACRKHKWVELAEMAFQHLIKLEPENIGYYVLLSNIYRDVKDFRGVLRVRLMMKGMNLKKEPGFSQVNCRGESHLFYAGDRVHPRAEETHDFLAYLEDLVEKERTSLGVVEEGTELGGCSRDLVGVHSERLAIAFGVMNSCVVGGEIVVMKNLRICDGCHMFIKSVSLVLNRRFVVRDASRFHHFEKGVCSCKNYW